MKILYHHRTASKDGQNVHIEELTNAFRQLGHELIIVEPGVTANKKFGESSSLTGVLKKFLPPQLYELAELAYSFVAYKKLKLAYLTHKPDFLYERYNLFLLSGKWLKEKYGLPYLLEVNAPLAHERQKFAHLYLSGLAKKCEDICWKSADMTLPVTQALAGYLIQSGVQEDKITVIQNGINRDRFTPQSNESDLRTQLGLSDKTVLGFTGFIRDWHGLNYVIDAIAEMAEASRPHLLVVGDGPAKDSLLAHAKAKNIAHLLTLTGVIQRDDMVRYISVFDIALQPKSVDYSSPLKIFEYMALGKAIIAPDQANIREILTHNEDALLFTPDDTDDFKNAIWKLCVDKKLRKKLGTSANKKIDTQNYTWKENAEHITSIAEKLCESKL